MPPKITALMSVYNGEKYLRESIESVLQQSFRDFELLIIDDASTDRTPAIAREYSERDERIRLYTNTVNLGLTHSLNLGLELAEGEYIARQDADDISLPTRFEVQRSILDANPSVLLVSGRVETIDVDGSITGKLRPSRPAPNALIPWMLLFYNYLQGHSVATFRRDTAKKLGGYDQDYKYSQDYELWLRMSREGSIEIPEHMLLQLRIHQDSISRQSRKTQRKYGLRCSQQAIEALSGLRLSRSDIQDLRNFWKGHFGKSGDPRRISSFLRQIFQAYAEHGKIGGEPASRETMIALRRLIQKQFKLWQRSTALTHAPVRKVSAGFCAARWKSG